MTIWQTLGGIVLIAVAVAGVPIALIELSDWLDRRQ